MKTLDTYIIEKFHLSKKPNLTSPDDEVLLFVLRESPIKFSKEYIDTVEDWIRKNQFTKFKIYSRNFDYLDVPIKFSETDVIENREYMGNKFKEYFPNAYLDSNGKSRYSVYSDKEDDINLNHNKQEAIYLCKHLSNGSRDPWIEMVIIGEK